jgi:glycosyltransferase involved in cell wall biosynthesis
MNMSIVAPTEHLESRSANISQMSGRTLITIFTATYNRAHTLNRAFESLRVQTLRDFEWLVVDDGSTDGTDKLVAGWMESANFPIRYLRQNHSGKHFAHNLALNEARGLLFTVLDSDDAFPPDALEKLKHAWISIPDSERHSFYSVGGLCRDQNGKIVGDQFPASPYDADLRQMIYTDHIRGEKLILGLTDILRQYPFPEIPGTYVPEGMLWFDVAKKFKTRWLNEVVRIYYVNDPATGITVTQRGSRGHHALGRWYYYSWLLNNDLEYFFDSPLPFLKGAAMLPVVGWLSGKTAGHTLAALKSGRTRLLLALMLPLSVALYAGERIRNYWQPAK